MVTRQQDSQMWLASSILAATIFVLAIVAVAVAPNDLLIAKVMGAFIAALALVVGALAVRKYLEITRGWPKRLPSDRLHRWVMLVASMGGVVLMVWFIVWVPGFVGPSRPGLVLGCQVFGSIVALLLAGLGIWVFTRSRPGTK